MTATAAPPAPGPATPPGDHSAGGGSPVPPRRTRRGREGLLPAELALVAVHVAVAAGFVRLYRDWTFLGDLVAFVVGAHAVAAGCRRLRLPAPLTAVIGTVTPALVAAWLLFPHTLAYGLPTAATADAAGAALREGQDLFRTIVAPAPALPGFQLAAGLALWIAVWFADWAAFRLRTPVEAVSPALVLFVFGALLGSGRHRTTAAAAFAVAVLAFLAAHRAWRARRWAWADGTAAAGTRALLVGGLATALLAVAVGAVAGPRLPGTGGAAVVDWRDGPGPGGRTTVSPIVDLRKRLVNQSDEVVFTVRTNRPAYWRLTALDRFDGDLWTSGGQFAAAAGSLGDEPAPSFTGRRVVQEVRIVSLSAIWVPAAFRVREVRRSTERLQWDPDSSTLIVGSDRPSSDGLTYQVVSELAVPSADRLGTSGDADPPRIDDRYGSLPDDFPDTAAMAARQATAGARTRYEQALALQQWFRTTFTYSTDVAAGHGDDALVDFLESREGYCEQFAGAYAAMSRSLGIPSRVAIGFTPGEQDPEDPKVRVVRGRHAHAWPELWFPGVGWVPFEPTPGRGIPEAEPYTGVAEDQDDTISTEPVPTTTTAPAPTSTTPQDVMPDRDAAPAPRAGTDGGSGRGDRIGRVAAATGAVALVAVGVVLAAPAVRVRRRRRRHGAGAVVAAWQDGVDATRWATGLAPRPSETPEEFASRAGGPLGGRGADLRELAGLVTSSSWSARPPSPEEVERARRLAATLVDAVRNEQGLADRLRRRLSWREAFGVLRPAG